MLDGVPLWERFLPEADAVLEAIGISNERYGDENDITSKPETLKT